MNDAPYELPEIPTHDQLIARATLMIDHYQFDAAAVNLALAQTLTLIQIEQRLAGFETAILRLATALELIAGKRGVIYTRDANGI